MLDSRPANRGSSSGFLITAIVLGVLSAGWVGYLLKTPFSGFLPEAALPADQIDALFKLLAGMGGVVLIYVLGYLLYFCFIFRRRASDPVDAVGLHTHDSVSLEVAFWVVPMIMVVVISVFSVQIWQGLQTSPGNALTVEAIGHQFGYDFRYPGLWDSVHQELHLPVGQPVTVKITSSDVIHGFWIPEIRLKADMVPGLINTLRFTPTRVGSYTIVCTEYCGVLHGAMGVPGTAQSGRLVIEPVSDFKKWLTAQSKAQGPAPAAAPAVPAGKSAAAGPGSAPVAVAPGDAATGKALFGQKCSACHSVGTFDQKIVGPGLGHLLNDPAHPALVTGEKAAPVAIVHILQKGYNGPLGMMPSQTQNAISDKDIANLTAYLVSLSK